MEGSRWLRFTQSAKRVLWNAQTEAKRLGERDLVGPEHVVLGLVHDADTAAAHVLERLGVSRESIRAAIEQQIGPRESVTEPGEMFLTPEGKQPIDLAWEEAQSLAQPFIGTQHLLVGLLRAGDSLSTRVLTALGVDVEKVRREIPLIPAEAAAGGGNTEPHGAGSG